MAVTSTAFGNDTGSSTTTVATGSGTGTVQNLNVTSGQPIIGAYACVNGGTVTGVTDTIGNTYTVLTPETTFGSTLVIFYCTSSTGSNASNVITVTISAAAAFKSVAAVTGTGFDTAALFLDQKTNAAAAATTISPSAALNCGTSDAMIFEVAIATNDRAFDQTTGCTEIYDAFDAFGSRGGAYQYKNTTGGGSQTISATVTGGVASNLQIATAAFTLVHLGPTINTQPASTRVFEDNTATFTVSATSTGGALSYQWQENDGTGFVNISGETSATLNVRAYRARAGHTFLCNVTDSNGTTATSAATLTIAFVSPQLPLQQIQWPPFNRTKTSLFLLDVGNWGTTPLDVAKWFAPELSTATSSTPTGTLARTNANDTLAATAIAVPNGILARTNANDTSSAAGTTTILSTLARTNFNDTSAASATPVSPGSLTRTNANDTLAASGNTWPSSTLARTNANDTLAASGSVGSAADGSVAYTNANDTSSATGNTGILSTLARTNANDTLASSGSPVGGGTLARTNNNDTSAAAAISTIVGTSSTTNANDTLSASGSAGSVPVGNLTYTNNNDTVSSSGSTTILSSLARTNNNDTLAASGSAGSGGSGFTTRLPLTGVGS